MTLALVFVLYGALDSVHLSGGVGALAFGIAVSNAGHVRIPALARVPALSGLLDLRPASFTAREKAFFSETVFLIKTFFFIYLGISLRFSHGMVLLYAAGLMAVLLVLRVPIVRLAMPRSVNRRDASLMAALAPKGLAAAVLAAIPAQQGWVGGDFIQELSYALILFSILGASVLVFLIESTAVGRVYARCFRGFGERDEEDALPGDRPDSATAKLDLLERTPDS
jgi:NhaP-type Na+/H+ or K+/H+ antiporter